MSEKTESEVGQSRAELAARKMAGIAGDAGVVAFRNPKAPSLWRKAVSAAVVAGTMTAAGMAAKDADAAPEGGFDTPNTAAAESVNAMFAKYGGEVRMDAPDLAGIDKAMDAAYTKKPRDIARRGDAWWDLDVRKDEGLNRGLQISSVSGSTIASLMFRQDTCVAEYNPHRLATERDLDSSLEGEAFGQYKGAAICLHGALSEQRMAPKAVWVSRAVLGDLLAQRTGGDAETAVQTASDSYARELLAYGTGEASGKAPEDVDRKRMWGAVLALAHATARDDAGHDSVKSMSYQSLVHLADNITQRSLTVAKSSEIGAIPDETAKAVASGDMSVMAAGRSAFKDGSRAAKVFDAYAASERIQVSEAPIEVLDRAALERRPPEVAGLITYARAGGARPDRMDVHWGVTMAKVMSPDRPDTFDPVAAKELYRAAPDWFPATNRYANKPEKLAEVVDRRVARDYAQALQGADQPARDRLAGFAAEDPSLKPVLAANPPVPERKAAENTARLNLKKKPEARLDLE